MEHSNSEQSKSDARFHLANERTLLAWVRTGIALMAFGFVVVKFSLFVSQLAFLSDGKIPIPQKGYSSILGIALVVIGTLMIGFSFIKYRQVEKQLASGDFKPSSLLVITLTSLLLVTSLLLILYLVSNS